MSIGTIRPDTSPAAPPQAAPNPFERVITQQLNRTRAHVKYVDLIGLGMVLVVGWLAFVLVVSIIDHWVVGLGFWGRLLALVTWIGGTIAYGARFLAPLLWRRVNPVYAARVIEESQPTLKNSLINFLMFRTDPTPGRQLIYQAMQQQAAADLTRVPIETAVDRSQAIRIGYLLTAVLAACGLYKIVSPKDPFQTISRVAAPWADIERPARVTIRNVEPGDRTVFHGQPVTVSAEILGTRSGEPVTLIYSTADGQLVDRPVEMQPSEAGLRYEAVLPPGGSGIEQSLEYRIVAGDAATASWKLRVLPAPTILVESLEYEFPAYTKRPRQRIERQGDIQALEGTRVSIHARANQPIASAAIDFFAGGDKPVESLAMKADAQQAHRDFVLVLNSDKTRQPATYQVRFKTEAGDASQFPVSHQIDVLRDLSPEIEILTPKLERIELPEDSRQRIEVRALDPDYALTRIRLKAVSGGAELLNHDLLHDPQGRSGQVISTYEFVPAALDLHAGDEVVFWSVAEDNRTAPQSDEPAPNSRRTGRYQITITAAQNAETGAPPEDGQPDPARPSDQQPNQGPQGKQPSDPKSKTPDTKPDPKSKSPDRQSKDSKTKQPRDPRQPDEKKPDEPSEQNSEENKDPRESSEEPQQAQGSDSQGSTGQSGGESAQSDETSGERSESETQQGSGEGSNGDQSQGTGSGVPRDGEPSASDGSDGASQSSSNSTRGNSNSPPGESSDGASESREEPIHDGEAVEKALEHLREQQQGEGAGGQPADQQHPTETTDKSGAGTGQESAGGNSADREQPASDVPDQQQPASDAANQKRPEDPANQPRAANQKQSQRSGAAKSSAGEKGDIGKKGTKAPISSQPNEAQERTQPNGGQPQGGSSGSQKDKGADDVPEPGPSSSSGATADEPGQQAPGGTRQPDDKLGDGKQKRSQLGEGGNPSGERERPENQDAQQPNGAEGQKQDPGLGDNGQSGAGQQSQDPSGSPEAQGTNQDRDKTSQEDGLGQQKSDEAQSPSRSERQSDSKGGQAGDLSGGGGKGGGQGANQQGNDSAGSNSAADQGAGAAQESGEGETGSEAGDDVASPGQTGQKGREKGAGTDSQPGNQQAGGGSQEPRGGSQEPRGGSQEPRGGSQEPRGSQEQPSETRGDAPGATKSGKGRAGSPTGGGLPDDEPATGNSPPPAPQDVPDGQDPNLDYARRATEMVLEHLDNQKDDPDPALLKKLGWTKEDLQKFLKRWQSLRRASDSENGKKEWNEAVRSLGLRPEGTAVRRGGQQGDEVRGLRDSGERFNPPPGQLQKYNAYRRSVSRAATKDSE